MSLALFNIVMDGSVAKFAGHRGMSFEGESISCMGHADDILLLADTCQQAQRLLRVACEFFVQRGLELNVGKCSAKAMGVTPAKKKLFAYTYPAFHVHIEPIKQVRLADF